MRVNILLTGCFPPRMEQHGTGFERLIYNESWGQDRFQTSPIV
jgi:hypothetical protein